MHYYWKNPWKKMEL